MEVNPEILEIADRVAGDRIEAALYTEGKVARIESGQRATRRSEAAVLEKVPGGRQVRDHRRHLITSKRKSFRTSMLDKQKRVDGRGYDDSAPDHMRSRPAAARAWLGDFPARRNAGARACNSGADRRSTEHRRLHRRRNSKRFILHYNFPPFSVGETGRTGGAGRREIGHGALAERSIEPIMPDEDDSATRSASPAKSWNQTVPTSMASVCGGHAGTDGRGRADQDARRRNFGWSGHASSARTGELKRYNLLTDIIGSEDHFGDMDFKLCGTDKRRHRIPARPETPGVSHKIMAEAVHRAKDARTKILGVMATALDKPRADLSKYAPRIETIKINPGEDRRPHRTGRQNDQGHRRGNRTRD